MATIDVPWTRVVASTMSVGISTIPTEYLYTMKNLNFALRTTVMSMMHFLWVTTVMPASPCIVSRVPTGSSPGLNHDEYYYACYVVPDGYVDIDYYDVSSDSCGRIMQLRKISTFALRTSTTAVHVVCARMVSSAAFGISKIPTGKLTLRISTISIIVHIMLKWMALYLVIGM